MATIVWVYGTNETNKQTLNIETLHVYQLLHDNFSVTDLRILCYDHFLPVYHHGGHDEAEAFIWRLLDFVQAQHQADKLFNWVKKYRRTAYEQFIANQLRLLSEKKTDVMSGVVFNQQGQKVEKQWNIGPIETANFS